MHCSLFNKYPWRQQYFVRPPNQWVDLGFAPSSNFCFASAKQELERQVNRLLSLWIILPESPISGWLTYLLAPQRMC